MFYAWKQLRSVAPRKIPDIDPLEMRPLRWLNLKSNTLPQSGSASAQRSPLVNETRDSTATQDAATSFTPFELLVTIIIAQTRPSWFQDNCATADSESKDGEGPWCNRDLQALTVICSPRSQEDS